MDRPYDLALVGCGNMGAALLRGCLARGAVARAFVIDRNPDRARATVGPDPRVDYAPTVDYFAMSYAPGVTVLAVKPQGFSELLPTLAALPSASGLVLSIAAGIAADRIRHHLPQARIVRGMPNTPALRGAGCTALWSGPAVSAEDRAVCERLFSAVGTVAWVEDEALIDAVTALSGGGPAYVFAFAEALVRAGEAAGLPADLALRFSLSTITGAAAMLQDEEVDLAGLKAAVRSPAGTTDAALKVFEQGGALDGIVETAVRAAHRRAMQLGRSD